MRQQTMMDGMTFKVASSPINPLTEASTYTKAIRKSSNNDAIKKYKEIVNDGLIW